MMIAMRGLIGLILGGSAWLHAASAPHELALKAVGGKVAGAGCESGRALGGARRDEERTGMGWGGSGRGFPAVLVTC